VHLVKCCHFWSRDKGGAYTIESTIAKNAMLHANFMASCFVEPPELLPMEVLHGRNRDFQSSFCSCDLNLDPMTLHIQTLPVFPGDILDVQI